jgi:hypothetical protein
MITFVHCLLIPNQSITGYLEINLADAKKSNKLVLYGKSGPGFVKNS